MLIVKLLVFFEESGAKVGLIYQKCHLYIFHLRKTSVYRDYSYQLAVISYQFFGIESV